MERPRLGRLPSRHCSEHQLLRRPESCLLHRLTGARHASRQCLGVVHDLRILGEPVGLLTDAQNVPGHDRASRPASPPALPPSCLCRRGYSLVRARLRIRVGASHYVAPRTVSVQSFSDYFADFRIHPESKLAGGDGPCRTLDRGPPETVDGAKAPAILISGHPREIVSRFAGNERMVLQKPFTAARLLDIVRVALDERARHRGARL